MRKLAVPIVGAALIAAMLATPALAKGGPPTGVETGNNLSVPAIFVTADGTTIPSTAPGLRAPCDWTSYAPGWDGALPIAEGLPNAGYWLQKTAATWGASCAVASSAQVTLDWGDNLTGTTALKAGKTIRVEVGLFANGAAAATGYTIDNLSEEGVPDRLAVYGTNDADGTAMTPRVWDHDATFTIATVPTDGSAPASFTIPASAEINSMGAVVYGFNWGQKGDFAAAGDYAITFTVSDDTTIGAVQDWNADTMTRTDHAVTLDITLSPKAGGRGGGGRGR